MTLEALLSVVPRCPRLRLALLKEYLERACVEFDVSTPNRQAAFIAQLAYESAEFRHFEELASGEAYENRTDLGNNRPGDGPRYKGRGPIQLTGRANYRLAGKALDLPLEEYPRRASDADVGFRVAGWFWKTHHCNDLADTGDFDAITKRINGGLAGKAQRDVYHLKAVAALCG